MQMKDPCSDSKETCFFSVGEQLVVLESPSQRETPSIVPNGIGKIDIKQNKLMWVLLLLLIFSAVFYGQIFVNIFNHQYIKSLEIAGLISRISLC